MYDSLETEKESIYITKYVVDSIVVMVDTPACTTAAEAIVACSRALSPWTTRSALVVAPVVPSFVTLKKKSSSSGKSSLLVFCARSAFVKGRDLQPDAIFDEVDKLPTSPAGAVGPSPPFLPDFVCVEIAPLMGTDDNGGLVTTH